jgi:predicted MFS family arabinose efflux permease
MPRLNKAIKILLYTNGIVIFAGGMLAPIYAVLVDNIGGDILDVGIGAGLFALFGGVTVLIVGNLHDRMKENELIMVVGYLVMAVGFLSYLFVNSVQTMFLAQILIGFGEAVFGPSYDALYSKHLRDDRAGGSWAAWEAMNYFVGAASAVLGSVIVLYFGFKSLFVIISLMCFYSAWYIYNLPRKTL